MKRFYLAALSVAALAACGDSSQPLAPSTRVPTAPNLSATTTATNEVFSFSELFFVPCANGGVGEDVLLEGTIHLVIRSTETANSQFSSTVHSNAQGLSGTGQITGDKYQGTGTFTITATLLPGQTETFTIPNKILGPGPENNFTSYVMSHFTVNANGEFTAAHSIERVECS